MSDTAPLWEPVQALLDAGIEVHCLRDLTRGGLASALNEIAGARGVGMRIEESAVPVEEVVKGACEILGLDPLYVANEGRFVAFVPQAQAARVVEILQAAPGLGASGAHRRCGRRTAQPGHPPQPHRRQPRPRHAHRRATAQNLLRLVHHEDTKTQKIQCVLCAFVTLW